MKALLACAILGQFPIAAVMPPNSASATRSAPIQAFFAYEDTYEDAGEPGQPFHDSAILDPARFDPVQSMAFNRLLLELYRPTYRWYTFGLDAAVSSYFSSPRQGLAPMAYVLHRALDADYWSMSLDPNLPEIREVFLHSARVGPWLRDEVGIPPRGESPDVIITPAVTVMPGQPIGLARTAETSAFLRDSLASGRALNLYLPINATALQGSGHYILAVARLQPAPGRAMGGNRPYGLTLDFYDPLMTGRCSMFGPAEQALFAETLARHLAELAQGQAIQYQSLANEYHQVRSQMPGTSHCGRYATLYLCADLLGIPTSEWYQERFNRVLPTFIQVFEAGNAR